MPGHRFNPGSCVEGVYVVYSSYTKAHTVRLVRNANCSVHRKPRVQVKKYEIK